MKISDYKYADCALFRLPPMDFSKINEAIEKAIVESWKNGESAQNLLGQVLNNSSVVKTLSEQIEDNLTFQRETISKQVQEDERIKLEQSEAQKKAQLQQISETTTAEANEKERIVGSLKSQLNDNAIAYTATEARLNELRKRVKNSLYDLGGEEKIEQLLTINDIVTSSQPTQSTESTTPQQASSTISSAQTTSPPTNYTIASENKSEYSGTPVQTTNLDKSIEKNKADDEVAKLAENKIEKNEADLEKKIENFLPDQQPLKKHGLTYRFFKGVWDILNYKLW